VDQLYRQALEMMGIAFDALSGKVGDPNLQPMGDGYVYRYKEKSICQAIIQKLARVVTGLHAISLLNKAGDFTLYNISKVYWNRSDVNKTAPDTCSGIYSSPSRLS